MSAPDENRAPDVDGAADELPPRAWSTRPSLADVLPWIAQHLLEPDAPRARPVLPDFVASDVVLLLVDGLGDRLLDRHRDVAPTLHGLRATTLRAGFPATTATSITSLTTGAPCGVHGIIGYAFRPDDTTAPGTARVLNALRWTLERADGPSALDAYPPERVAPLTGALSALGNAGVAITYVMPEMFRGTGLTRAALRATGRYLPADSPEAIRVGVATALSGRDTRRGFVYTYLSDLDAAGHRYGPESPEWLATLGVVDRLVADLASDLPADAVLAVTGDHGMIAAGRRIDLDADAALTAGVEHIAGEPRVRHLYVATGAASDTLAGWVGTVGDEVRLATRDQVIDECWFGPRVAASVVPRIGDVVAVARGRTVLVRGQAEPAEARMIGHHGAWTADEQFVPLLLASG